MFTLIIVFISVQLVLCVDLIYYIEEGQDPNTYLGNIAEDCKLLNTISAQEKDLVRFSQIGHDLMDGSHLFRVSAKTGKLYTNQKLDAESMCIQNKECSRSVDIAVEKDEVFIKILEIKILVLDINDHSPEFPKNKVKIEFFEDDARGIAKEIPSALDKDIGKLNSKIEYELKIKSDDPFSLNISKQLDETDKLQIYLEDNLDRETKDVYHIQVIAKDKGVPSKENVLYVEVKVVDVNDNNPVFPQKLYNITVVNENYQSLPILILSASDRDEDENADISYHFSRNTPEKLKSHFEINQRTGELFLQRKFNSRHIVSHKLYVKAVDRGKPPLSSMAVVLISIKNQTNKSPKLYFTFVSGASGKTAIISEQIKVGSFIAYIKVEDEDVGLNGEITCQIKHDKFQLVELSSKKFKVVTKHQVDRELNDYYDVPVVCHDKGTPPLSTIDKFSVIVTDINDEYPKFSKELYQFWIKENNEDNISVGVVSATDADLGSGGQLHFYLSSSKEATILFQISSDGVISTKKPLDREQQSRYNLEVIACDKGTPPLTSTANISIMVTDENDNAPYFTFPLNNPFMLNISYNSSQNNITVLKAKDIDWGQNAFFTFSIVRGNKPGLFDINHYSGLLLFARQVGINDSGTHELQLSVKDSGTPALTSFTNLTLTITVSNKRTKIMQSTEKQIRVGLDSSLLAVIILVVVLLSMSLAIPLTWCIIKYNNKRKQHYHTKVSPSDANTHENPDTSTGDQLQSNGLNPSVILETTEITQQTCVQGVSMSSAAGYRNQFDVNSMAIIEADPPLPLTQRDIINNPEQSIVPYAGENSRVRAMKILQRALSCPDDQTNNMNYLFRIQVSQIRELSVRQPEIMRYPCISFHNENQSIIPQLNIGESVQYHTRNQKLYRIHSIQQNTQKTYKKHCNNITEQKSLR
ncbi:protocadherin beta-16-like [Argonauta hians]